MMSSDSRLLEAAASGKTDLVLQLLEEEGSKLHDQKDQVSKLHFFGSLSTDLGFVTLACGKF